VLRCSGGTGLYIFRSFGPLRDHLRLKMYRTRTINNMLPEGQHQIFVLLLPFRQHVRVIIEPRALPCAVAIVALQATCGGDRLTQGVALGCCNCCPSGNMWGIFSLFTNLVQSLHGYLCTQNPTGFCAHR